MRQYLTKESYNSVVDATVNGSKINRNVADHISTSRNMIGYIAINF